MKLYDMSWHIISLKLPPLRNPLTPNKVNRANERKRRAVVLKNHIGLKWIRQKLGSILFLPPPRVSTLQVTNYRLVYSTLRCKTNSASAWGVKDISPLSWGGQNRIDPETVIIAWSLYSKRQQNTSLPESHIFRFFLNYIAHGEALWVICQSIKKTTSVHWESFFCSYTETLKIFVISWIVCTLLRITHFLAKQALYQIVKYTQKITTEHLNSKKDIVTEPIE